MNKAISKAVLHRTWLRSKCLENRPAENWLIITRETTLCHYDVNRRGVLIIQQSWNVTDREFAESTFHKLDLFNGCSFNFQFLFYKLVVYSYLYVSQLFLTL